MSGDAAVKGLRRTVKMRSRVAILAGIITLVSLSMMISIPEEASAYTPHDPIHIQGNAEFTIVNGVTGGSGTSSDPYIIENWEIDATASNGIEIRDTSAHFVLRDCWIYGDWKSNGVHLNKAANGRLQDLRVERMFNGIDLRNSGNSQIVGTTVSLNGRGIILSRSDDSTVINNTASHNDDGIYLLHSNRTTVTHNEALLNNGTGIQLTSSDDNIVADNEVSSNDDFGMVIISSDNNMLTGNEVSSSYMGIFMRESSDNIIAGNIVSDNDIGLHLDITSDHNIISNNSLQTNLLDGIYVEDSSHNTITNNTVSSNRYGIRLKSAEDNVIHHNSIISNGQQAFDDGRNAWDSGYPSGGNYWSDEIGVDKKCGSDQSRSGSDGISDTPYAIDGGSSVDRYPLMEPFSEGEEPDFEETSYVMPIVIGVAVVSVVAILILLKKRRKRPRTWRRY